MIADQIELMRLMEMVVAQCQLQCVTIILESRHTFLTGVLDGYEDR